MKIEYKNAYAASRTHAALLARLNELKVLAHKRCQAEVITVVATMGYEPKAA